MFSGLSPVGKLCLVILAVAVGLTVYAFTIGGDSRIGSVIHAMADEARTRASDFLPDRAEERSPDSGSRPAFTSPLTRARDACFSSMFLRKGGSCFSIATHGPAPAPHQFRGLKLVDPASEPLLESDPADGIDKRLRYRFALEAYRVYDEDHGWGSWLREDPPGLSDVVLVRQDGEWKVASAPVHSYSLP